MGGELTGNAGMANGIKTQQKGEARQQSHSLFGAGQSRELAYNKKEERHNFICSKVSKLATETKLETVIEPGNDGLCHQCGKTYIHQSLQRHSQKDSSSSS